MQDETGTFRPGPADDGPVYDGPVHDGPGEDLARPDAADGSAAELPRPLPVPRPETGEFRVDAALSLLDELSELPVTEHPAMFEQVHAQLSEVLGELSPSRLPRPDGPPGRGGS
jgi:hypothetical protein